MSMMPDYNPDDDFEGEDAGLIDEKAIAEILEKATDALRSLGMTVRLEDVTLTVQNGQTFAIMPVLIRKSAKKKLKEDRATREDFNKMMAADNEAKIKDEAERIRDIAMDPEKLFEHFFGTPEECAHENQHEGLCLDCNQEV